MCETKLLEGSGNRFGIYQLRNDPSLRDYSFAGMKELKAKGLSVERKNYEFVYTAPFSERVEFLTDRCHVLNKLYYRFNLERPKDFVGHSLSIGDVVVLRYNGDFSAHFCDVVGFVEIDAFPIIET